MTSRVQRLPAVRWWGWAIVVGVVLGVVVGIAGYLKIADAPYTASTQVLVTGRFSDSQVDSALSANQYVDQRMSTYAEVADSEQVTGPAARDLRTDSDTLADEITATVEGDTTVMTLAVQGDTPQQAVTNAAAVTKAFTVAITNLESNGDGTSRVALSVISQPVTPPARRVPGMALWIIGGVVLFTVLAWLAGLLLRWLFPKWQTAQQASGQLSSPAPAAVAAAGPVAATPTNEPVIVRRTGSLAEDATETTGSAKPAPKTGRTEANAETKPATPPAGQPRARSGPEPDNGPPTIEIPQSARRGR
jgi:capsular polysaccharide biosynthesis protein